MEFNKQVNKPLATFATTISTVTALHFYKVAGMTLPDCAGCC